MNASRIAIAVVCLLLNLVGSPAESADIYTALIVRMGGAPGLPLLRVSITIDRYTDRDQTRALLNAFATAGEDGMLAAVRKLNVGLFTQPGVADWRIRIAQLSALPSGRRIVIAGERASVAPIAPLDEYPFFILTLKVDDKGRGTGELINAAAIRLDELGTVYLRRYVAATVQLLVEVRLAQ